MTRTTNARIAGFTFLFYIAAGVTSLVLTAKAMGTGTNAERLASIAQHASLMRVCAVLGLLECASAIVLAGAIYAITRDDDRDIAVFALCFRLGEGCVNAIGTAATLALSSVAMAVAGAAAPDAATATAVGALLLKAVSGMFYLVSASLFAIGSTLYCYIFVRARSIPVSLAWLGLVASILLVVVLPLQILGLLKSPVTDVVWIPMAVFEVVLAVWLIVKGVRVPDHRGGVIA